jgi:hypothetical protein
MAEDVKGIEGSGPDSLRRLAWRRDVVGDASIQHPGASPIMTPVMKPPAETTGSIDHFGLHNVADGNPANTERPSDWALNWCLTFQLLNQAERPERCRRTWAAALTPEVRSEQCHSFLSPNAALRPGVVDRGKVPACTMEQSASMRTYRLRAAPKIAGPAELAENRPPWTALAGKNHRCSRPHRDAYSSVGCNAAPPISQGSMVPAAASTAVAKERLCIRPQLR